MKGNAECHIPNNKYRGNYDKIFSKDKEVEPSSRKEEVVFVNRKLGDKIKENLKIVGGELQLTNGTCPKEYLKTWADFNGLDDGEPVCVCTIETLRWLEEQAIFSQ